MAERFNFDHYSKNDGDARRIIVEKTIKRTTQKVGEFDTGPDDSSESAQPETTRVDSRGTHGNEDQYVPSTVTVEYESMKEKTGAVSKKKRKNIKAQSAAASAVPAKETPPMGNEALMEEFASLCKFARCKKSVSVLDVKCRYCILMFCRKHRLPEVHGCYMELTKRHAPMKLELSSTSLSDWTLPAKLQAKLKEMKEQRQKKK